jgi:hypothetical protein
MVAGQVQKIGVERTRRPDWSDQDDGGFVRANLVKNSFDQCPRWIGEGVKGSPRNGEGVRGLGEWIWSPADEARKLCCEA